jgi:hypothetical protein
MDSDRMILCRQAGAGHPDATMATGEDSAC